jgi:hypothetical protein
MKKRRRSRRRRRERGKGRRRRRRRRRVQGQGTLFKDTAQWSTLFNQVLPSTVPPPPNIHSMMNL